MIDRDRWIERSIRLYAALLVLYPRRFRQRFADEMVETLRSMLREEAEREPAGATWRAWRPVAAELLPTVVREHAAVLAEVINVIGRQWRGAACRRAAIAGLRGAAPADDEPCRAARDHVLVCLRCRGRVARTGRCASVGAAVRASLIGAMILVVIGWWSGPSDPSLFSLTPLLLGVSATAALILALYVRLVTEGVSFPRAGLATT